MPPPDDPFAQIAELYDLDFEDFRADVTFYERLVEIHGRRVLELGVGTGRIATPLVQAGAQVTGVDISPGMLAIASARSPGDGLRLLEDDIRSVRLRGRFDVVMAPLGTLQHLDTSADFVAALETMAHHLAPGGVGVVDVETPLPDDFDPRPQPVIEHWTKAWQGGTVSKVVSIDPIPSEGTKEITWHFDIADAQGRLRRITTQFRLRTFTVMEMELGARLAGLRIAAVFDGYGFEPYHDAAERMVVVLQREDDPVGYIYEPGGGEGADEDEERAG